MVLFLTTTTIDGKKIRGLRPVSDHYPLEPVHTLTPGNHNQVYYNTGGSAVLTNNGVRLVPAVSGRNGWLWNEYPIESNNFEAEIAFEIHSKPHFGGDGFAIWFVQGNSDPSFYTDPTAIDGPVMGMNDNFNGIGVIIDTYDNDGRRNNPSIFAVKNDGSRFQFRPDQDFEGSMITDLYKGAHRCVNDLRNTNRPVEMVIKVINQALFVYINSHPSTGYRSCFSVNLNLPEGTSLKGSHLAITSSTGQVSDHVDIHSINVRYLRGSENLMRENELSQIDEASGDTSDILNTLIIIILIALSSYLLFLTYADYQHYLTSTANHIDAVIICRDLNNNIYTQFSLHLAIHLLFLVTMRFFPFVLLLPATLVRMVLHTKGYLLISPALVAQFTAVGPNNRGGNGILGMSLFARSMMILVSFAVVIFLLLLEFFFGWYIF